MEKSHKKLHKFLRDFEKVIQEPATVCMKQDAEVSLPKTAKRKKAHVADIILDNYVVKAVDLKVRWLFRMSWNFARGGEKKREKKTFVGV